MGRFFRCALLGEGEELAYHHGAGPGRQREHDIAAAANAAIRDERNAQLVGHGRAIAHCGELRNAESRHHAGRAGGSGADSHLHRIRTGVDEVVIGHRRAHVAGYHLLVAVRTLELLDESHHLIRVPVGDVHAHPHRAEVEKGTHPVDILHAAGNECAALEAPYPLPLSRLAAEAVVDGKGSVRDQHLREFLAYHTVHVCGNEGDVDAPVSGQPGLEARLGARWNVVELRHERDFVERVCAAHCGITSRY